MKMSFDLALLPSAAQSRVRRLDSLIVAHEWRMRRTRNVYYRLCLQDGIAELIRERDRIVREYVK